MKLKLRKINEIITDEELAEAEGYNSCRSSYCLTFIDCDDCDLQKNLPKLDTDDLPSWVLDCDLFSTDTYAWPGGPNAQH